METSRRSASSGRRTTYCKLALSIFVAAITVLLVLLVAVRFGPSMSRFVAHESDEIILLTTFGTVLLVAGIAQRLQVSAAIGAFLVGIAVSGPMAEHSHQLLSPVRDLFAATFFFFFGLQIDPAKASGDSHKEIASKNRSFTHDSFLAKDTRSSDVWTDQASSRSILEDLR